MQSDVMRELFLAASEVVQPRLKESPAMRRLLSAVGRWLIEECRRAEAETGVAAGSGCAATAEMNGVLTGVAADETAAAGVNGREAVSLTADAERPANGVVSSDIESLAAGVEETVQPVVECDAVSPEVATEVPTNRVSVAEPPEQAAVSAVISTDIAASLEPAAESDTAEPADAMDGGGTRGGSAAQPSASDGKPTRKSRRKGLAFKGKPDFTNVRARASFMEQACELAIQRLQRTEPTIRDAQELATQIKLLRDKLQRQSGPVPRVLDDGQAGDATLLSIAKACYGGLYESIDLLAALEHANKTVKKEHQHHAVTLMAEVTSMLEEALEALQLGEDHVVEEAYAANRQYATRHSVFSVRYLHDDECGDSSRIDELRKEIRTLMGKISNSLPKTEILHKVVHPAKQNIQRLLNKHRLTGKDRDDVRRELANVSAAGAEAHLHLLTAVRSVEVKVMEGMDLPDQQLLAELGEFKNNVKIPLHPSAEAPKQGSDDAEDDSRWSEEVAKVREKLRGRKLLLVGGTPRPEAKAKLVEAFELAELFWDEITEHTSAQPLKPRVDDPNTAVVVVIPKFIGHVIADNVQAWCRAAGKPCVMTNGGYNPNGVAHAICKQASVKLGFDPMPDDAGEGI